LHCHPWKGVAYCYPQNTNEEIFKDNRNSLKLDFACIVAIDEPLMWQDLFKKEDIDKWKKIAKMNIVHS
jgi:hypothetical protein